MIQKKKGKISWKVVVLPVVLIAVVFFGVLFMNRLNSETTAVYTEMQGATLPLLKITTEGEYETTLHGYTKEMSLSEMHDVIFPIGEDRTLNIELLRFENTIQSLSYHIYSLGENSYVDNGEITEFSEDTSYKQQFVLSNLMNRGEEYQIVFHVVANEKDVYFYGRILYAKVMYGKELLDFTKEFSNATFSSSDQNKIIINNIQPTEDAPADNYAVTTIHSKYAMFTYGDIQAERSSDIEYRITEFEPTQMSVTLEYTIQMKIGDNKENYNVSECFVVRYRSGKIYLLDYYRTLEHIFEPLRSLRERGRILLGILSESPQVLNSENMDYTAFIVGGELWRYEAERNTLNLIFSFKDAKDTSGRSSYNRHNMQVVKVSDDGSVDYMVYGYLNRGVNEGEVGICFYRYNAENNETKRLFYMPLTQSELVLMNDLGTLAYVNSEDVCYLRYGDNIYSIDLNSGEAVEVTIRAYPGRYAMNEKGNVVAWEEGESDLYPERIVILNMDTQTTAVVSAPAEQYVKILGFFDDDIIYAFGNEKDSLVRANMDAIQLLTKLLISSTDERLTIQKEYDATNFYIQSAEPFDTRLVIHRVRKDKNGMVSPLEDDILLITQNVKGEEETSTLMSRVTDPEKKNYYIQLGLVRNTDSQYSEVVPRFPGEDTGNHIQLLHRSQNAYYIYAKGKLLSVESEINVAIRKAYDSFGVVIDSEMKNVWNRGTRDLVKSISIQEFSTEKLNETLSISIQILAAQNGIQLHDAEKKLDEGQNPISILNEAFKEERAVNLYGCSLQEVLYFINEGCPVMVILDDRDACLLVGYDTENVQIFDPYKKNHKTMTMTEAEEYFESFSNPFVSYQK